MNENIDYIVNEIQNDLDGKIVSLNDFLNKADDSCKGEVEKIVLKTIGVLKDATKLILNTSSNSIYDDNIMNYAKHIKEKSNALYDDALKRISSIYIEKTENGTFVLNDTLSNNISNLDKVSQNSISILNAWFKSEDVQK